MTLFFSSHEINIYRRRRIGSTNRFAMSATFTAYNADIQPASRERIEMVEGRLGKTWSAYTDVSVDVKEGDQLAVTDKNGNTARYSVRGVSTWDGAGLLSHKELVIVSQD